jgi:hypothetical protein
MVPQRSGIDEMLQQRTYQFVKHPDRGWADGGQGSTERPPIVRWATPLVLALSLVRFLDGADGSPAGE